MKRRSEVAAAILLSVVASAHAHAQVIPNCKSQCEGSGGVTSPVEGDVVATGEWTWGSADDAANSCSLGEVAGAVVFEGASANAFETSLAASDPGVDVTYNLPAPLASGAGTYSVLTTAPQLAYHLLQDEFLSGLTSSGNIGALGWTLGAGTWSGIASIAAHPGQSTFSSTNSSGTIGRMYLATAATQGAYVASDLAYFGCLINPRSGTTTMSVRVGLVVSVATSTEGSQGIYWSFNPAVSANWRTVTRDGTDIASNSSDVVYATSTWYLLEVKRAANGTDWEFWINGVLKFTHTTRIITATAVFPGIYIETNEAVAKTLDGDWCGVGTINPMGSRF